MLLNPMLRRILIVGFNELNHLIIPCQPSFVLSHSLYFFRIFNNISISQTIKETLLGFFFFIRCSVKQTVIPFIFAHYKLKYKMKKKIRKNLSVIIDVLKLINTLIELFF